MAQMHYDNSISFRKLMAFMVKNTILVRMHLSGVIGMKVVEVLLKRGYLLYSSKREAALEIV